MNNKQFSERLNKELDEIGVPEQLDERIDAFSKWTKLPKFKAEALLNGNMVPDAPVLEMLATEFEVSTDWLLGKTHDRANLGG